MGRLATHEAACTIADIRSERAYTSGFAPFVALANLGGARTLMLVPMLKEDHLIGAIAIYRQEILPFHRQADRAGAELRRAGGDRHREHAAAERTAPAHRRPFRIAAAADSHRRRAQGHQPLDVRPADGARHVDRIGAHDCARRTARASIRAHGDDHYRFVASYGFPPEFNQCMRGRRFDAGDATPACLVRSAQGQSRSHSRYRGRSVEFADCRNDGEESADIRLCSLFR